MTVFVLLHTPDASGVQAVELHAALCLEVGVHGQLS